jgi:hypothetical protein
MKFHQKLGTALAAILCQQLAVAGAFIKSDSIEAGIDHVQLLPLKLTCVAGSGDVSRPLTITNPNNVTIKKNTLILWTLTDAGVVHGQQQLNADLKPNASATLLGPAGSGGKCAAHTQ